MKIKLYEQPVEYISPWNNPFSSSDFKIYDSWLKSVGFKLIRETKVLRSYKMSNGFEVDIHFHPTTRTVTFSVSNYDMKPYLYRSFDNFSKVKSYLWDNKYLDR